jgi:hypothetical protein
MLKAISLTAVAAAALFSIGCQTASAPGNSANVSVNGSANVVNANQPIPPEFSSKPANIDPANLPPGITDPKKANSNTVSNGQIAPGINPNKAVKTTTAPTPKIPGIPSEAELKKQMANTKIDPNVVNGKVNPPQPSNAQGNSIPKIMQTGKPKPNNK